MSHPGSDGTPEGQQPGRSGPHGQQPVQPGRSDYYGQQPGQPDPYQPFDQQPGQPGQPAGGWVPPQGGATPTGEPEKRGGVARKVLLAVGGVLVVLVVVGLLVSMLGAGEPEVGDCVLNPTGEEVEIVDCGSAEAEARIVGIDEQEIDYTEFAKPETIVCADFPEALNAIWVGADQEEPGTIYCAEPV
ncbi:hypothetical protein [Blastococcus sp. SYSU DS0539]